jgi:hypothetical protein
MRDTHKFAAHLGRLSGNGLRIIRHAAIPVAVNATRMSGEVFAALE